jgi:hypothetical protein
VARSSISTLAGSPVLLGCQFERIEPFRFNHILTFVSRKGFIALNVATEADALNVARMIADETGCSVVVRDDQMIEIDTIPARRSN